MRNISGPPVEGDDFFGREKEIDYAWSLIQNGNNLVLPSPRRVGKTSFALKLLENAQKKKWKIISINLEEYTTELEIVEDLAKELVAQSTIATIKEKGTQLLNVIKQIKPTVEYEGVKASVSWESQHKDVYEKLMEMLDHEQPTLIFLDELTVPLTHIVQKEAGISRVTSFLHWLRSIRIKSKSKVRWIYCSSVGIENFTHTHNISDVLNDTKDYFLKSFDSESSKNMLSKLGSDNDLILKNGIPEAIVDKLEFCLPFFLQIMFEKIHFLHKIEDQSLSIEVVENAYERIIEENHFNTWIERIEKQYGDLENHAFAILKHNCQEKKGSTRSNLQNVIGSRVEDSDRAEEVLSKLLYMLKNDGYLIEESGQYIFRSPLLRDFWYKRYVR